MTRSLRTIATCVAMLGLLVLAGCAAPLHTAPGSSSSATATTPEPEQSRSATSTDSADAFREREAFIKEQQLPLDGSFLVAVTEPQKQFIAEQKAYVESQGSTWTVQDESIALALAADACETSILNSHIVNAASLQTHVATSPLFPMIIPESITGDARAAAVRNVASLMVFGTSFLCPDDAVQWETAFTETYG